MSAIVITKNTNYATFQNVVTGTVFKYTEPSVTIEEVVRKFEAQGITVKAITPGTRLYTLYGSNHCVVTDNPAIVYVGSSTVRLSSEDGSFIGGVL